MGAVSHVAAQLVGAIVGFIGADLVFGEVPVAESDIVRTGGRLGASELIVTFVLALLVLAMMRSRHGAGVASAVGAWVVTIILARPSAGFANPAVTVARGRTDTSTGIESISVSVVRRRATARGNRRRRRCVGSVPGEQQRAGRERRHVRR
jgi:glycerol uptake facilitator-like aquaporin